MKKHLFLGLFLLLSICAMSQSSNNKYRGEWMRVNVFQTQDLPKSAINVVDTILKKAIADKNNTQVIKALIYKNKYLRQIDGNDSKNLISELQALANEATNINEKALLHSMLAELYFDYYNQRTWEVNKRTKLIDLVPEDIDEWSSNIFRDKIVENLNLSIKNVSELKKQTAKEYDDIILIGKDGAKYYPTLYDFLMDRAITLSKEVVNIGNEDFDPSITGVKAEQLLLPAKEYIALNLNAGADNKQIIWLYYQQFLKELLDRGLSSTVILTELDKIQFLSQKSRSVTDQIAHDTYIRLDNIYGGNETSVLIIDKIVDSYTFNQADHAKINEEKYNWLTKGIKQYPNFFQINLLKNKLASLEEPLLSISNGTSVVYPNTPIDLTINYKNTQSLENKPVFTLFKVEKEKYIPINKFDLTLVSKQTYNVDTLSLNIGSLPFGKYCFSTYSATELNEDDEDDNRYDFVVSSLLSFTRSSAPNEYEIFVVDRLSGKPIERASIKIYPGEQNENKNELLTTLKTNSQGLAVYRQTQPTKGYWNNVASYQVEFGKDNSLNRGSIYSNYDYSRTNEINPVENIQPAISIFADRSIYRPGQTVYFKAIALNADSKLITKKSYTVKLYNANSEIMSQQELTTNDFGSIAGNFILPQGGLNGNYRIEVDNQNLYFKVEEYKRPTFEVTFDKLEKTYSFGSPITLKGNAKSFSGINLQDADVKYNITRQAFNFWWWNSSNGSYFTDGTVKTNDDGSFEIIFTPEAGDSPNNSWLRSQNSQQIYTFNITATVTDLNGESQSEKYSINVGNVSMVLNMEVPSQIEKTDSSKINILAKNLQGADIEASGSYKVFALADNDSITNMTIEGTFKTGEQEDLVKRLKALTSGRYQIQIEAKDDKGNDITAKQNVVIYSYDDKKPPYKTTNWLVEKNTTFGDKPVEIIYGTSDRDKYVLYQLFNNNQVFERRYVKLSDENQKFKVNYKPEYGDEIYMSLTMVNDGELNTQNILLKKEQPKVDNKLNVKLETFRDKLRPGQEETWTLSIKDSKSKPVNAEVLASMYDISLDKLYPYTAWMLNRPYISKAYLYPMSFNQSYSSSFNNRSFISENNLKDLNIPKIELDKINWFGYLEFPYFTDNNMLIENVVRGFAMSPQLQGKAAGIMIRGAVKTESSDVLNESVVTSIPQKGEFGIEQTPAAQIRKNFNETAFFYPQLRTNENGETLISFTVPESNTTWRFRTFAYDKKVQVGTLEQMVVTRKELMVTPNMPRFVRQGDKTNISTKISNLSEAAISGDVRIEFFDPTTDKVIDLNIPNQKQSFSIEKDASTSANWTFDIPKDIELLGCRIVAQNETFSDGEQHVLAVLSNRMLVTESLPIDIVKEGTSIFTMDKLVNNNSSTASNYRLTLEYASNPAWYAVQALPTMSNPTNDNAVNWFASYYVNTLGASIVRQYPKVSAMIQAWQKQGADKETLVSKLQKNEELKSILLEETPWVLDAQNETEQMQRLSLLFDLNNTKQLTDAATKKLSELMDNSDKAWSWYKGLYPSRSITQYILYGYATLQQVGQVEYSEQIKTMQINALKYIDKKIVEDFDNLKKNNKDWAKTNYVSTSQIEYAYVRSFYRDIPISKEAREAERFYTDIASKNWTKLNMYERSLITMILLSNGDKSTANSIVKSIKENAITDKLGMHWANKRVYAYFSMSNISTHTFIMEALKATGATNEEMNQMKRWLLNQKRTQVWESTHASIDAVNALLNTGSNWFSGETSPVDIKVGTQKIEPNKQEAGTGYFIETWNKSEIRNDMGNVEVKTPNSDPAFGALYWQYYEDLNKITKQAGDLNISKQLFKEVITNTGKGLTQVIENNPLTVGDKVIMRLTIKVDRDMEFVSVKDMRAPCFEPTQTISGVKWMNGLIYYQTTKDASTNFYFDRIPKGTYVLEYPVYVNRTGEYANGITTIQCMYAPEFTSHTQGITVTVNK